MAIKLAKIGYYNGDPEGVLNAPVHIVEGILNYEEFTINYEEEYIAINKQE